MGASSRWSPVDPPRPRWIRPWEIPRECVSDAVRDPKNGLGRGVNVSTIYSGLCVLCVCVCPLFYAFECFYVFWNHVECESVLEIKQEGRWCPECSDSRWCLQGWDWNRKNRVAEFPRYLNHSRDHNSTNFKSVLSIVYYLVSGLNRFLFFHRLGIIIPSDFHIFQRGRSTTNQLLSLFSPGAL